MSRTRSVKPAKKCVSGEEYIAMAGNRSEVMTIEDISMSRI